MTVLVVLSEPMMRKQAGAGLILDRSSRDSEPLSQLVNGQEFGRRILMDRRRQLSDRAGKRSDAFDKLCVRLIHNRPCHATSLMPSSRVAELPYGVPSRACSYWVRHRVRSATDVAMTDR